MNLQRGTREDLKKVEEARKNVVKKSHKDGKNKNEAKKGLKEGKNR